MRTFANMEPEPLPFYRRSTNGLNLYKVTSMDAFEEIQIVGSRRLLHHVNVLTYPDRVFLSELRSCAEARYEPVEAAIWESELARCAR